VLGRASRAWGRSSVLSAHLDAVCLQCEGSAFVMARLENTFIQYVVSDEFANPCLGASDFAMKPMLLLQSHWRPVL